MVTTNDAKIAQKCMLLRPYGMTKNAFDRQKSWYYDVQELGYNYRLNEVQAALGISQLMRLDQMIKDRRKNAQYLTKKLSRVNGIITPSETENCYHTYHLYVIRVIKSVFGVSRNELFKKLSQKGIGLSVHYTPLHLLSFYKKTLGYKKGDFPIAEELYEQILSLPMYSQLTKEQIDFVIQQIVDVAKSL